MTAKWGQDCFVGLNSEDWARQSSSQKIETLRLTLLDVRSGFWRHFHDLQKRIEVVEKQAHGTHSRHEDPTQRERELFERLGVLEQRLEKLAAPAVHQPTAPVGPWSRQIYACTPGHPDRETWEHPAGRVEQWSRIEAAARHLVAMSDGDVSFSKSAFRRLQEALSRE